MAFISAALSSLLERTYSTNPVVPSSATIIPPILERTEEEGGRKLQKIVEYKHLTRGLDSIKEIFEEYSMGVCGKTSTKRLEERYQMDNQRWWGSQNERNTYFKRIRVCHLIEESLRKCAQLTTVLEYWEHCCELHFKGSVTNLSYALAESARKEKNPIIVGCKAEFDRMCGL